MKKEKVEKLTWIGRTLVVCEAVFTKGKCTRLEVKEYRGKDAQNKL